MGLILTPDELRPDAIAASSLIDALSAAPTASVALLALPIFLVSAAASDAYRFIIPNWTSLGLVIGWLAAWALSPLGWSAFGAHALVFLAALGVSVLLFELGVWGGGDAKLAPCALLWLGWPTALEGLLIMSYASAALALAALGFGLLRRLRRPSPAAPDPQSACAETAGLERHTHAPYGVAIAAGALWAAPSAPVVVALAPSLAAWIG